MLSSVLYPCLLFIYLFQFVMSKLKKEDYSEILGTKLFVGNQQVDNNIKVYLVTIAGSQEYFV